MSGLFLQGLVLLVAGMGIVYVFLWLMILVVKYSNQFVCRFNYVLGEEEPKAKKRVAVAAPTAAAAAVSAPAPTSGEEVKAPVPGTVLRISVANGHRVAKGDEILVMDVMKMETPMTATCDGRVNVRVAAMDKVATGDVLAVIG